MPRATPLQDYRNIGIMEEKLRFAIREGGRTVGAGVVAAIIE